MRFLKPNAVKLLLFAILIAIAIGGSRQAEEFHDHSRPFLTSLPLWVSWVYLLLPVAFADRLLEMIGAPSLFDAPLPIFWGVQAAYFYFVACVLVAVIRAARREWQHRRAGDPTKT